MIVVSGKISDHRLVHVFENIPKDEIVVLGNGRMLTKGICGLEVGVERPRPLHEQL